MRREQRLRHRREFTAVYRRGRQYRSDLLVLRARRTDLAWSRFGFAVGTKVGNAVTRNRIKRRLRHAARTLPASLGWDVVVSAQAGAAEASYERLQAALRELTERAGLLKGIEGR